MADRVQRVIAVIEQQMAKPYCFGKSDCFLMCLRVADAIQGSQIARQYEGIYASNAEIVKYMAIHKHKSLADVLRKHFEVKAPAMLQFGDIAIVQRDFDEHVAVCCGAHFLAKSENGRKVYRLDNVTTGFAV